METIENQNNFFIEEKNENDIDIEKNDQDQKYNNTKLKKFFFNLFNCIVICIKNYKLIITFIALAVFFIYAAYVLGNAVRQGSDAITIGLTHLAELFGNITKGALMIQLPSTNVNI